MIVRPVSWVDSPRPARVRRRPGAVLRRMAPRVRPRSVGRTGAMWVPSETPHRAQCEDMCARFMDDRRLIRPKLLLLAVLVLVTAVLEQVRWP